MANRGRGGSNLDKARNEIETGDLVPKRKAGKKRITATPVRELARHAVEAILSKKGREIVVLDVHAVSGVADIFLISTGDSDLQIRAIHDAVQAELRERAGEKPWHVEGTDHAQWVLMDYVDLVVHIFSPEKREFYSLERLWGDAPREQVPDDGVADEVALLSQTNGSS